jgi:hypothetical protein
MFELLVFLSPCSVLRSILFLREQALTRVSLRSAGFPDFSLSVILAGAGPSRVFFLLLLHRVSVRILVSFSRSCSLFAVSCFVAADPVFRPVDSAADFSLARARFRSSPEYSRRLSVERAACAFVRFAGLRSPHLELDFYFPQLFLFLYQDSRTVLCALIFCSCLGLKPLFSSGAAELSWFDEVRWGTAPRFCF